ncbi:protein of unknown function [Lactobacillus delbrueckii subsp. delbrueckii]|uniref:Uncharacterized protein n=1 Tax=Lactobacillus delbrueckii subsp. delbrueckii TaxID=83684 RepID=A0AAU9QYF4_9LACO|nr:protein of unknown function [Lactobacillus delbrueckii subsp. delbrueckii]
MDNVILDFEKMVERKANANCTNKLNTYHNIW